MAANPMFTVVPALDLNAQRDVYVGLPVENTNKQTFHRIPIRSSCTESDTGDRRIHVKFVPGSQHVVQSTQGLRRLLIKFPSVFVPGIKVFEASNDNDRTNLSMGFALFDSRVGPSPDETKVMENLDGLAAFLRNNLVQCDRIRRMLKIGGENMTSAQQQVAADMMDLHVARPVDSSMYNRATGSTAQRSGEDRPSPARYCYVKLVAPDPAVSEKYHTFFWTVDGRALKFDTVLGFRNFQAQPFVEVEDIFVSKAVRSIQLKLRECLVVPPAERMQQRYSVCFPDRVCSNAETEEEPVVVQHNPPAPIVDDAIVIEPPAKRMRVVEEDAVEDEPEVCPQPEPSSSGEPSADEAEEQPV